MALAVNSAQAQITTQMLIGDAVSEIGTRYADVDEAIKRFANRDVLGARQFLESAKRKDTDAAAHRSDAGENVSCWRITRLPDAHRWKRPPWTTRATRRPISFWPIRRFESGGSIEAESLYDKGLQLTERIHRKRATQAQF